jgi:hypothetical protein
MQLEQFLTLVIAIIGAVLGVLNTWRNFSQDRLRLKVVPKFAFPVGTTDMIHPGINFSIEVINRSTFPVTITEVGFLMRGTKERAAVPQPILMDGSSFPRRLEAREAASFLLKYAASDPEKSNIYCAYASTACGSRITGVSPALKSMVKRAAQSERGS